MPIIGEAIALVMEYKAIVIPNSLCDFFFFGGGGKVAYKIKVELPLDV